jgi:hypothetical protein
LARLEWLTLRGWVTEMRRDPRFALSILIITVFSVVCVATTAGRADKQPWVCLALAVVTGFSAFRSGFIAPGSAQWQQLRTGVLQPWTGFGQTLKRWVYLRAAAVTTVLILGITAIVALTQPGRILACLGALGLGAGMAAATANLIPHRPFHLPALRLPTGVQFPLAVPVTVRVSLNTTFRRKVGFAPMWLLTGGLWALATPASALATHNNPGAHVGFAMITVAGLICALVFSWPNLRLIRFLAFQPIAMRRIVGPLCGPQVGIVALAAIAAAFGAGQPFGLALVSAAVVAGATCLWLALLVPYAMTRSVHAAPAMALCEVGIALIVKFTFQFGVLAVGWLIFRITRNNRIVARHRWKEPL